MALSMGCLHRFPRLGLSSCQLLLKTLGPQPAPRQIHVTRFKLSGFHKALVVKCVQPLLHNLRSRLSLQQPLSWRCFASLVGRKELANVGRNTLVYSYSNDRYYKIATVFGIMQLLIWFNISSFAFYVGDLYQDGKNVSDPNQMTGRFYLEMAKHKYGITMACVILAYLVSGSMWILPRQSVHKLYLMKGGKKVKIVTYNVYASKRTIVVPVKDLSCRFGRVGGKKSLPLKVKGRRLHFLVDNENGKFSNPEIYDHVIGLNRMF